MIIYPAIDLIDNKVVRLRNGDYDKQTNYSDDPLSVAKSFVEAGASWLHVIDLTAAKNGVSEQNSTIAELAGTGLQLRVGGGIRSVERLKEVLVYAKAAIVSTVALKDPTTFASMVEAAGPERIVVSVDYKDGEIATNGWLSTEKIATNQFQAQLAKLGIKNIITTDISKDGTLQGANTQLVQLWKSAGFSVTVAGGVATIQDIIAMKSVNADGVIIGSAIYEKTIDLREAIDASQ